MKLVFDMDGTIANLYGVDNWLTKLRTFDVSPYLDAEPLYDFERLTYLLRELESFGVTIAIVSWLSKDSNREYDRMVRNAKRTWLTEHGFPFDEIHLVKYGTLKQSTLADKAEAVLFDDNDEIREKWNIGEAVHPDNMIEYLERIYKMFMENR